MIHSQAILNNRITTKNSGRISIQNTLPGIQKKTTIHSLISFSLYKKATIQQQPGPLYFGHVPVSHIFQLDHPSLHRRASCTSILPYPLSSPLTTLIIDPLTTQQPRLILCDTAHRIQQHQKSIRHTPARWVTAAHICCLQPLQPLMQHLCRTPVVAVLYSPRIKYLVEWRSCGYIHNGRALERQRIIDLVLEPNERVRTETLALRLGDHGIDEVAEGSALEGCVGVTG